MVGRCGSSLECLAVTVRRLGFGLVTNWGVELISAWRSHVGRCMQGAVCSCAETHP